MIPIDMQGELFCLCMKESELAGKQKAELLQGTLDMLVLKVLRSGSQHGYGIVRQIQRTSKDMLNVEEGSLYPALHRMERKGWIKSKWGLSESNRRAKFYRLTPSGRKQVELAAEKWKLLVEAVSGVMAFAGGET